MAENRKSYHATPHDEGWQIKPQGADRATKVLGTKDEAAEPHRIERGPEGLYLDA